MTSPPLPDPAVVLSLLAPPPSPRWCVVEDGSLEATAARLTASDPALRHLDTSPTAQETDTVSGTGLGLHTDGYSEVPDHPSILLLTYSQPVELRVLGVEDVVAALGRAGSSDVARRLATTEAFVDADLTPERAHLLKLSSTGEVVDAVVSPAATSVAPGDALLIGWWVRLWRDATSHAPAVPVRAGHTVVIDNRRAAHGRTGTSGPGLRVRRVWLTPARGQNR